MYGRVIRDPVYFGVFFFKQELNKTWESEKENVFI